VIYGARGSNGGPNTEWTFTGDSSIAFDIFNNATEVALFEGLVPNQNNELILLYTTTNDGSTPRGDMSFMQIFVGGASDIPPFGIIAIDWDRNEAAPTYTVTWSSRADGEYALSYSTDLEVWEEVTDSIASGGATTSYPHALLPLYSELIGAPTLFYRVERGA
jgi:hypothetical protein